MSLSFKPIRPLLHTGTSAASRWFSYIGLGTGVLLLLCSVQMFVNIQDILGKDVVRQGGYDFISITKTITNETMGQEEKNMFSEQEVEALRKQPFIEDVAPLIANRFRVQLNGGEAIPFRTDFILETIEDDFIDTLPEGFNWQPGQPTVPLIISSDFLEIFNLFAPTADIPQFSRQSAAQLQPYITIYGKGQTQTYKASIMAFTDRINSILVPKEFLDWANEAYGDEAFIGYARVYLKTKDANNADLISYLDQNNFRVNKERTKFGRTKQTLQGIFSGLGVFGFLVVLMALMLFSFYLQLVIARSKDNLQLLLLLGYSPGWLGRNVSRQFVPVYILIFFTALAITQVIQFIFHKQVMYNRPELQTMVHWSVILMAVVLAALSILANFRMVKKLLYKLY